MLLQPQAGQSLADTAESLGIKVRDVMQVRVAVVRENTSLRDAARALALGGFHALPVLAIDDTPMGIVTSSDLLGLLIDGIDRDPPDETAAAAPGADRTDGLTTRLLEVLRAAEVYLHSGQSDQQHARLTRAVDRAREMVAAA